MSMHRDSPLNTTYGADVDKKYTDHAHIVADAIKAGGVTVRPEPGSKPLPVGGKEWYGLGGAADPATGEPVHPKIVSEKQFGTNDALGHVLDVERQNIDRKRGNTPTGEAWPAAYVGGWLQHGEAVMDTTSVFNDRERALKYARKRPFEEAVFDAKNIEDIPNPAWNGKQRS
jgi:hypothetical protein